MLTILRLSLGPIGTGWVHLPRHFGQFPRSFSVAFDLN